MSSFSLNRSVIGLLVLLVASLAAIPIVAVLGSWLQPGGEGWQHLRETTLAAYVTNSLLLMVLVAAMTGIVGVSTAWLVTATRFPGRSVFSWALVLPLAAPAYVIAYLYTDLLSVSGPMQTGLRAITGWSINGYWFPEIRSVPGAAMMLSLVLYPYVYLLARAAFSMQTAAAFQAARTLGRSPWGAFTSVALPGARPAIAGGVALALMETLADYGVADYFAIPTFSTGIFRTWLGLGDQTSALRLAALLLVMVGFLVMLEAASRRGRQESGVKAAGALQSMTLHGAHAWVATGWCALPVVAGFLIPVAVFSCMALSATSATDLSSFIGYARNSIVVATATAVVAIFIALLFGYALRYSPSPLLRGAVRVATLGYALPGALLAVGLLGPLGGIDRALTGWLQDSFGWSGGLVLSGTLVLLVYACTIRFLTVAHNAVGGSFAQVPLRWDEAARVLGAGHGRVMTRIHLPILAPGVLAGALLVFIDTLRELPATLILRPFNFETLATRIYRLASDERLVEASSACLALILIGIMPIVILLHFADAPRRRQGSRRGDSSSQTMVSAAAPR